MGAFGVFYGYRVCPGWYQGATRPPRGRRDRGVVFRILMVNAELRTSNLEVRTSKSRAKPPKATVKPPQGSTKANPKPGESRGAWRSSVMHTVYSRGRGGTPAPVRRGRYRASQGLLGARQPSSPARSFPRASPAQDTLPPRSALSRHPILAKHRAASRRRASRSVWLKPCGSKRWR